MILQNNFVIRRLVLRSMSSCATAFGLWEGDFPYYVVSGQVRSLCAANVSLCVISVRYAGVAASVSSGCHNDVGKHLINIQTICLYFNSESIYTTKRTVYYHITSVNVFGGKLSW